MDQRCGSKIYRQPVPDSAFDALTNTNKWSVPTDGGYITAATASKGIFAQAGNIGTLIIGEDLVGIGNYAFMNAQV